MLNRLLLRNLVLLFKMSRSLPAKAIPIATVEGAINSFMPKRFSLLLTRFAGILFSHGKNLLSSTLPHERIVPTIRVLIMALGIAK